MPCHARPCQAIADGLPDAGAPSPIFRQRPSTATATRRHTAQGDSRESVRVESTGEVHFDFQVTTMGMGRFGYMNSSNSGASVLQAGGSRLEDEERDQMLR